MQVKGQFAILFLIFSFSYSIADQEASTECTEIELAQYAPPYMLQHTIDTILSSEMVKKLEEESDPRKLLESAGFKILQYLKEDIASAVVIEHKNLPGYVIKFMRIGAPQYITKKGARTRVRISDRVVHNRKVAGLIKKYGLKCVKVPKKYFYCLNHHIALIISQKIQGLSQCTLKDLSLVEVKELLLLVEKAQGILDLKPKNMMIAKDGIYFIDTERHITKDLPRILKPSVETFKKSVNPLFEHAINDWYRNLSVSQ